MKKMMVIHCDAAIATSKETSKKQVIVMKKHVLSFQKCRFSDYEFIYCQFLL